MKKEKKYMKLIAVMTFIIITATVTISFANNGTNTYNPNSIQMSSYNIESKTPVFNPLLYKQDIVRTMNSINLEMKSQNKTIGAKEYKSDEISLTQIYKLYQLDKNKLPNVQADNFEEALTDTNLYWGIFISEDQKEGSDVIFAKNPDNGAKYIPVEQGGSSEAIKVNKFYNDFIKNNNIVDVKVFGHPSHPLNKLFLITEKSGEKYIIPLIVDNKEAEVGLKSYKKYDLREALENIISYLETSKNGLD